MGKYIYEAEGHSLQPWERLSLAELRCCFSNITRSHAGISAVNRNSRRNNESRFKLFADLELSFGGASDLPTY